MKTIAAILAVFNGYKTYIVGAISILVSIAVARGYVLPENKDEATKAITNCVELVGGILGAIASILAIVVRHGSKTDAAKVIQAQQTSSDKPF